MILCEAPEGPFRQNHPDTFSLVRLPPARRRRTMPPRRRPTTLDPRRVNASMQPPSSTTTRLARRAAWCAAYLLVALVPLTVGAVRPGITGHHRMLLEDMVYARAHKPFVKRQLVPILVRGLTAATPANVRDRLETAFERSTLITRRLHWPAEYATEFVWAVLLMYAGMVGFLVALQRFLVVVLDVPILVAHITACLVGLGLPVCFSGLTQTYDFPQLFLFTAGAILLRREKWWPFYPLYAVACLNKETSVLLPFTLFVWQGIAGLRRPYLAHLVAQTVIAAVICGALAYHFRDHPGDNLERHFDRNIRFEFTTLAWIRLALLATVVATACLGLRRAPRFLQRGSLATFLPLLSATLLFGYIDELRDYYEAYPFVIALVLLTVGRRLGVRPRRETVPD